MDRGDIYQVTLDPTVGTEQRGTRRVLVLSTAKFNAGAKLALVVPVTHGGVGATVSGLTVSMAGSDTFTDGVILCAQLRSMDLDNRRAQFVEKAPEEIVEDVLARVQTFFE